MSKNRNNTTVSVLLSGGLDSTACIAFYLDQGFLVHSYFVDYGQVSAFREGKAAVDVAKHYGIHLEKLKWSGLSDKVSGFIQGRNAFLLIAALMELSEEVNILAIGIHSGTNYVDCTSSFIHRLQDIFDIYTQGKVHIGAPFLKWTKRDVWDFCFSKGVPVKITYSCEFGMEQPCGQCLSCRDLEELHACS